MVAAMVTHSDMAKPVRHAPPACATTQRPGPSTPSASSAKNSAPGPPRR